MFEETPKVKREIDQEWTVIEEQLKHKALVTFDIRNHIFQTVVKDVSVKEESDKRSRFINDVGLYHTTDNVLIRTAIGKKWAYQDKYDYDYDDSLISSIIMREVIFAAEKENGEKKVKIKHTHGYEYMISCEEGGKCVIYRGDTMNSWSTTLDEYIRCFGGGDDGYFPSLKIKEDGKNKSKWCIAEEDPAKNWIDFLSIPANYKKALPSYITDFLDVVYTIGNFIPVLKSSECNFNTKRNLVCKDYWDLTLLAIYNYYHAKSNTDKWKTLLGKCRDWLGEQSAENWNAFVEKNFLQDFVNSNPGGGYGCPKELWAGHFNNVNGDGRPSKEEEFRSFFTNASDWIIARGTRIMIALDEIHEKETETQEKGKEDA